MKDLEKIKSVNNSDIYSIIHKFRAWNKSWDKYCEDTKHNFETNKLKPKNIDDFVLELAKEYEVKEINNNQNK